MSLQTLNGDVASARAPCLGRSIGHTEVGTRHDGGAATRKGRRDSLQRKGGRGRLVVVGFVGGVLFAQRRQGPGISTPGAGWDGTGEEVPGVVCRPRLVGGPWLVVGRRDGIIVVVDFRFSVYFSLGGYLSPALVCLEVDRRDVADGRGLGGLWPLLSVFSVVRAVFLVADGVFGVFDGVGVHGDDLRAGGAPEARPAADDAEEEVGQDEGPDAEPRREAHHAEDPEVGVVILGFLFFLRRRGK
mmetsp:Transcript_4657/g.15431  ORF Transcript_4657/g.15431 Transcript_4657/m.15431 type:complete len:244 (-) Transcript_4657:132-863(-)